MILLHLEHLSVVSQTPAQTPITENKIKITIPINTWIGSICRDSHSLWKTSEFLNLCQYLGAVFGHHQCMFNPVTRKWHYAEIYFAGYISKTNFTPSDMVWLIISMLQKIQCHFSVRDQNARRGSRCAATAAHVKPSFTNYSKSSLVKYDCRKIDLKVP